MKAKSDFDSAPAVKKDGEDCAKTDGGDKGKAMNADSVDAIVQERISLLRLGDRLNLDGTDAMTIPQLKRAIIKAVKPAPADVQHGLCPEEGSRARRCHRPAQPDDRGHGWR